MKMAMNHANAPLRSAPLDGQRKRECHQNMMWAAYEDAPKDDLKPVVKDWRPS